MTEGVECELTSTVSGATIKIVAPTSVSMVLNPYKLGTNATEKEQVQSPVYFIENQSSLDIEIGVSMTASADGVKFVDTPAAATADHERNLLAFMQLKAAKDKTVSNTGWTKGDAYTAASDTIIPLATTAKTGKIVLAATDGDAGSKTDTLQFKFSGVANDSTSSPWSQENAVTATIAFTFKVDGTTTTTP